MTQVGGVVSDIKVEKWKKSLTSNIPAKCGLRGTAAAGEKSGGGGRLLYVPLQPGLRQHECPAQER